MGYNSVGTLQERTNVDVDTLNHGNDSHYYGYFCYAGGGTHDHGCCGDLRFLGKMA